MEKLWAYYQLTKPNVTYGNVLTAVAGFFLAAAGQVDWLVFFGMLSGMTLVIAAACALNNYYDRDIDSVMHRTKKRPSVTGEIAPLDMVLFAVSLLIIGLCVLAATTNWLVVAIGLAGFVTYVWLYGTWTKRTSVHGTAVGAVSGAFPIAGGYAAVSGVVDPGMIVAFLIIFFWQFPEFYSIAIYRRKEYAAAKIPLMSVVKGVRSTTVQIFVYTILYVLSTLALTLLGLTGWVYFAVMLAMGGYWVWLAAQGLRTKHHDQWARRMFRFAMVTILVLCLALSLGPLLP